MYTLAIRYRFYGPKLGPWQILDHADTYRRLRDAVTAWDHAATVSQTLPHGAYDYDLAVVRVRNGEVVKVMYQR